MCVLYECFNYYYFFASAVLKTVENVGVSYVKLSEPYTKKLDHESKNLNLPYRPESVSLFFNQPGLNVLLTLNTHLGNKPFLISC